jgi:iron(III) transport system substrate-binding protein
VDIHVGGTGTGKQLKDLGFWDPFKPNLIRPDVLDSSKWLGGFEAGMMDTEATYAYGFEANARPVAYVNREVVPESQLARVEQLLDPQWKGKISWNDPRQPSGGASTAGHILMAYGEDFLRKLLQQNIANTADLRQQVEWIVRGTNPVAIGMDETSLVPFLQQGLGKNVVPLEPEGANSIRIEVGFGAAFLFKNAPHPNASKVYLNWLLSQEGQQAWTVTERASRRLDVNNPAERAPKQNRTYQPTVNHETNYRSQERAQQIAAEYLK